MSNELYELELSISQLNEDIATTRKKIIEYDQILIELIKQRKIAMEKKEELLK